jgi:leucyl aminopeptidase
MSSSLTPEPLTLLPASLDEIDTDWLIVPVWDGETDADLSRYDAATGGQLTVSRASGEWKPKRYDLLVLPSIAPAFKVQRLVFVFGGPVAEYSTAVARRLATAAALQARERRAHRVTFVHRLPGTFAASVTLDEWLEAIAEGLTLAEFHAGRYKSAPDAAPRAAYSVSVEGLESPLPAGLLEALARGRQVAHCANLARELINEPGNLLSPALLADRAIALASGTALKVEVIDEAGIRAKGMGLLAAVGQGSRQPPRLIIVRHEPESAPPGILLGLVGKGVTFDSGGLSLKTADGMERMKDDMTGGASVLAAMRAIALLGVPVRVVGLVPCAENMPDGGALRPGDVLRSGSGRTVEVVNTDAEGRLLMADALWYARQLGATHLLDIATLTGACMVALGRLTAGVFGRPADWCERVLESARRCGEPVWSMPLVDEEHEQLDSEIADTANCGSRYGAAITASLFLSEFAAGTPWVHVDVAGPSWYAEARRYLPKGPTGFGIRTMVEVARSLAADGGASR